MGGGAGGGKKDIAVADDEVRYGHWDHQPLEFLNTGI